MKAKVILEVDIESTTKIGSKSMTMLNDLQRFVELLPKSERINNTCIFNWKILEITKE